MTKLIDGEGNRTPMNKVFNRRVGLRILCAALMAIASMAMCEPRIECQPPQFDFGVSDNTGAVERTFLIWNRGDSLLEINRIMGCCGASTRLAGKAVPPGTNTTFQVVLSLRGRQNEVRKAIYLGSNDPKTPFCPILVIGKATAPIRVEPLSVDFGNLQSDMQVEKTVTVSWQVPYTLTITNAVWPNAAFAVVCEGATGSSCRVRIRTVTPLPQGVSWDVVRLFTDSARCSQIEIGVVATVKRNAGTKEGPPPNPVVIDYFYEAGCPDCFRVRDQVMPELKNRFEDFYRLNKWDITDRTNVIRVAAYQEKLGITSNEPVCMVVDYRHVFNGFAAIKTGLFSRMDQSVSERLEPGWKASDPIAVPETVPVGMRLLEDRVKGFTLPMVLYPLVRVFPGLRLRQVHDTVLP